MFRGCNKELNIHLLRKKLYCIMEQTLACCSAFIMREFYALKKVWSGPFVYVYLYLYTFLYLALAHPKKIRRPRYCSATNFFFFFFTIKRQRGTTTKMRPRDEMSAASGPSGTFCKTKRRMYSRPHTYLEQQMRVYRGISRQFSRQAVLTSVENLSGTLNLRAMQPL